MDGEAWQVHGVAKSRKRLSDLTSLRQHELRVHISFSPTPHPQVSESDLKVDLGESCAHSASVSKLRRTGLRIPPVL